MVDVPQHLQGDHAADDRAGLVNLPGVEEAADQAEFFQVVGNQLDSMLGGAEGGAFRLQPPRQLD
jgi:hypothetical protein